MCCTTKHSRSSDKVQVDTRQQHMGCQHMGCQHMGCQHTGWHYKGLVARVPYLETSRPAMG